MNFLKKWMQFQFSEISAILNKFLKLMPVTRAGCWRLVIVSLVTEEMWSNGKISPLAAGGCWWPAPACAGVLVTAD